MRLEAFPNAMQDAPNLFFAPTRVFAKLEDVTGKGAGGAVARQAGLPGFFDRMTDPFRRHVDRIVSKRNHAITPLATEV